MTSTQVSTVRPVMPTVTGLAWRAALIIVATVAVVLELPAWARGPLAVAAAVVTALAIFSRFDRRNPLDRVLTAVGAIVVALALLGIVLNVLPWGLTAAAWGIAVGVVELVTVTLLTFLRPPVPRVRTGRRRVPVAGIAWGVGILAVLAGALVFATLSFGSTHTPPLALSGVPSGGSMVVKITSGTNQGPFDLVRVSGKTHTVLASGIELGPDSTKSVTIAVDEGTREEIELVKTGTLTPVRELIVDTRPGATKANP